MSKTQIPAAMESGLSVRQRRFFKLYLDPDSGCYGNASQAALKAGYVSDVSGRRMLRNVTILDAMERLMDEQGLSDLELVRGIAEGVKANKLVSANINLSVDTEKEGAGAGKKNKAETSVDLMEYPDHPTRERFIKDALLLKRRINNKQLEQEESAAPALIIVRADGNSRVQINAGRHK